MGPISTVPSLDFWKQKVEPYLVSQPTVPYRNILACREQLEKIACTHTHGVARWRNVNMGYTSSFSLFPYHHSSQFFRQIKKKKKQKNLSFKLCHLRIKARTGFQPGMRMYYLP